MVDMTFEEFWHAQPFGWAACDAMTLARKVWDHKQLDKEHTMDSDEKTCGKCRHGNFYDGCKKCEDDYEKLRAENERLKHGEFICQKCGLRKNDEHPRTHEF